MKVLLSGGGTGGHIFPAVAIADELKGRFADAEFLFIGANGKMEMEKVPQAGYSIKGLDIQGLDRSALWKNIRLPFKILKSINAAHKIIKEFNPDFVVGTGGYASGPALYAASRARVTYFIQEQNAFAGLTNRLLSKGSRRIYTAYQDVKGFPAEKTVYLGNPVRSTVGRGLDERDEAVRSFGLDPGKLVVLSVGGSLGSQTLNNAWLKNLENLKRYEAQLIWQTGKASYGQIQSKREQFPSEGIFLTDFLTDMNQAYSAADIIVSRAGAIAISELALVGKASILVPYPLAAENHQEANALSLVSKNAAVMVRDNEMDEKFWLQLSALIQSPEQRTELSSKLKMLARPTAVKDIVDDILDNLNIGNGDT